MLLPLRKDLVDQLPSPGILDLKRLVVVLAALVNLFNDRSYVLTSVTQLDVKLTLELDAFDDARHLKSAINLPCQYRR